MKIKFINPLESLPLYSIIFVSFNWRSFCFSSAQELDTRLCLDQNKNVPKRNATYLAGRYCSKHALIQAGFDDNSIIIPTAISRAPIWPHGWVGSITHTDEIASAAVARDSQLRSIGIDIEKIDETKSLYKDLEQTILTPSELLILNKFQNTLKTKIIYLFFSMKESIFKCFFPLTQNFLEFYDVEIISLNMDNSTLEFKFNKYINEEFNCDFYHCGSFQFFDNFVFTSVTLDKLVATC